MTKYSVNNNLLKSPSGKFWESVPEFVSSWKTDNLSTGSSASNQIRLPLVETGTYDFIVYWGDGSSSNITSWNQDEVTHTYSSTGIYTIKIFGTCHCWAFNNTGDRLKIIDISQWGSVPFGQVAAEGSFHGCANLTTLTATDAPKLVANAKLTSFFRDCRLFNSPLNHWDTSNVIDMGSMFSGASVFNQNIGSWDVSHVTSMNETFIRAYAFNNGGSDSIKNWDVSSVIHANYMFYEATSFNQNIGAWRWSATNPVYSARMFYGAAAFNNGGSDSIKDWNTDQFIDMSYMFRGAAVFNQPIGSWNTGRVTTMTYMFNAATAFNNGGSDSIKDWNTGRVTTMASMFEGATVFNQNIGTWDTSNVTNMSLMFKSATAFNQDLSTCNVSNVTTFKEMFRGATLFNNGANAGAGINGWNTANATDLSSMFRTCPAFNRAIGGWNTSKVTTISSMFEGAVLFNQDVGAWDVSKVTNMFTTWNDATAFNNGGSDSIKNWDTKNVYWMWATFKGTAFNQPIGSWDVSGVFAMDSLFKSTPFNQDISGWDVSNNTTMNYMFASCPFNQDISSWNIEKVTNFQNAFGNATAFRQNVGAWWMRSASDGYANMFANQDMNVGGSPTNLITTGAQDFPNAAWTKTNLTSTANTTTAPNGTTTADSLKPSVTNSGDHSVKQTRTVVNGTAYTVRVALKAKELTWGQLICSNAITARVYVNLSTGAIESSVGSVSVTDIGDGWYVLEVTGTASTTNLDMQIKAWNNASGTSFAGNASDAIYAWQASMFDGGSTDNYSNFLKGITGWTSSGASRTGVTAATVAAGGSGYTVGDVLTVVGGTLGIGTKAAEVKVATIDGAGSVLTVTVHRGSGNYDTQPANDAATTGGTGTNCTLTLTWGTKFAGLPVSKAFHGGGNTKYSVKDRIAVAARKNLTLATGSGGKGWTITSGGPI